MICILQFHSKHGRVSSGGDSSGGDKWILDNDGIQSMNVYSIYITFHNTVFDDDSANMIPVVLIYHSNAVKDYVLDSEEVTAAKFKGIIDFTIPWCNTRFSAIRWYEMEVSVLYIDGSIKLIGILTVIVYII